MAEIRWPMPPSKRSVKWPELEKDDVLALTFGRAANGPLYLVAAGTWPRVNGEETEYVLFERTCEARYVSDRFVVVDWLGTRHWFDREDGLCAESENGFMTGFVLSQESLAVIEAEVQATLAKREERSAGARPKEKPTIKGSRPKSKK